MAEVQLEDVSRRLRDTFDKGFSAFERSNLDYAISMFEAVVEQEPRLLKARKYLRAAEVRKFLDAGSGKAKHMTALLANLPGLIKAKLLLKSKPERALAVMEKLLKADPLQAQFIILFAEAAVGAGLPEAAIQTLELAREYDPENIELLRWLARLYRDTGKTQEARLCYEVVARLKPNDPVSIKNYKDSIALDTMKKGGWEDAKSHRELIKDSKEAESLETDNKAVKSEADLDALITEFRQRIEREPENINFRRVLAEHCARAKRFDEALEVLHEAQKITGRADPQVDRAISSLTIQKFDVAIETAQAAGDTAAVAAQTLAKSEFVFANAKDLVTRYPNDLQFHYELGVLYYERGAITEAIEGFQLAQRNPQRRTRALYYLALCFKSKQQYDIALEQLEKAAEELSLMDDTKKDIVYEMGLLHDAMGQTAKAVERFKEIYAVDIRYKDVAERIEKAYKR
jgi:tetratricopeptide (TPR) repeat protein